MSTGDITKIALARDLLTAAQGKAPDAAREPALCSASKGQGISAVCLRQQGQPSNKYRALNEPPETSPIVVVDQPHLGCTDMGTAAAVQVTPQQHHHSSPTGVINAGGNQQVGQQGPVSGTTDRALPHARLQLEPQQKRSKQQPPAEPNLPLEMVEPQLPPCQQPQTQQVLQHMRLPPLPQQQQQQGRVQQQAAPLTLQVPSPEARRASLAVAGACGGNTGVCIKERSSSGGLISPRTGSSGVLGLQDLTSPTPYAPKYYISHEGTIAASSQQRKQLMLSIPRGDVCAVAAGNTAPQSPVGKMMASLLAETAAVQSVANTPWANAPPAVASLFSPGSAGVLEGAGTPLASPRVPAGTAIAAGRAGSWESGGQEFMGPSSAQQEPGGAGDTSGHAARSGARKRPIDATLLDPRCAEVCNAAQAAAVAAMGSPSSGISDQAALEQWQQTIEAAEQQWGPSHPAVGRAWLELARVWQAADKESDKAKHATKKAFDVCQILLQQTAMESQAQESFQYLLDKFNRKSTAAKQAQQAAADAAKEAAATALEASTAAAGAAAVAAPGLMGFMPMMHPAMQQQYPAMAFVPGMCMHADAGSLYTQLGLQQATPAGFAAQMHPAPLSMVVQQQPFGQDVASQMAGVGGCTAVSCQRVEAQSQAVPITKHGVPAACTAEGHLPETGAAAGSGPMPATADGV